jgi:hypothetical protein
VEQIFDLGGSVGVVVDRAHENRAAGVGGGG